MIAYNKEWLQNRSVRNEADKASGHHCISKEERDGVYAAHPAAFYSPNVFVRIGLFILTLIIVQFAAGLIALIFFTASRSEQIGGILIFFGLLVYAGLEFMIKKRHYKSGVDDALIWISAGYLVGGLNALTTISWLGNAIIIFMVASFFFLRFTTTLMAPIASLALLAIIFYCFIKLGSVAKAIMPFILMLAAAVLYLLSQGLSFNKQWRHYKKGLLLVSIIALVCLYAAGNYFVVREASVAMFNLNLHDGDTIPLGWLFWLFTLGIPAACIVRGLQTKDSVLLRVGLILVAATVATVRCYYHFIPAETAMVIGGIALILIAYSLTKYLHTPKHGFTGKEQADAHFMDKLQIESLVIAQTFSAPHLPAETGTQFGGGSGGGGGATGEF